MSESKKSIAYTFLLALLVTFCWHLAEGNSSDGQPNFECGISVARMPKKDGLNDNEGFELIFHGSELDNATSLPWMATLQAKSSQRQIAFCTATIIGPRHIMTAAHCDPELLRADFQKRLPDEIFSFFVGIGSTSEENEQLVEIEPDMIRRHPDTKLSNMFVIRDMLLIELPEALDFSGPKVKPICLSDKQPPENWLALAAGWGLTRSPCEPEIGSAETGETDQLHIGQVEIQNNTDSCRLTFQNYIIAVLANILYAQIGARVPECFRKWIDEQVIGPAAFEDKICTRPKPSTEQHGDSGGPLLVYDSSSSRWRQIGIVSLGFCSPDKPMDIDGVYDVYTRIDCDWIKQATNETVQCVD